MSDKQQVRDLVIILKNTYNDEFATYHDILKGSMETFARHLFQNRIIGDNVHDSKDYSKMVSEFQAGLQLAKEWDSVEQYCQKFLDSITACGRQPQNAAKQLKESWQQAVLREMGMKFLNGECRIVYTMITSMQFH